MAHRVLDPIERTAEILFGLVMVLTLTSSISVSEGGRADIRPVLAGAIACNVAWGLVDAVMYVMSAFMERARGLAALRAVREARDPSAAREHIRDALPPAVSAVLTPADVETLRSRLVDQPDPDGRVPVRSADLLGALGVFLLVFLSTLPVVVPFLIVSNPSTALRVSNAVAMVMLFATGWMLGRYAGRPPWRVGLGMIAVGMALVAITIMLGG